mmetsp:Transcript_9079/g.22515  ORF Transcript_9079/g.22515 Transcript_9079/m.22515 type:complete len:439 (-) Transcript_9079:120-1436(-)
MEHDEPQQLQQPRQLLQLIDEEEWFNIYGLRQASDDLTLNANANANDREISERVARENSYQKEISAKIFAQEEQANESNHEKRSRQLQQWTTEAIDIVTTNFYNEEEGIESSAAEKNDEIVVIRTNLKDLASRSDTVFAMASNQHLFHSRENESDPNAKTDNLSFSLVEYSTESVKIFLKVLLSSTKDEDSIPPEFVIDSCRLAHYLQCQQLLDSIVDDYLMAPGSIDHENCRFLCKLADELSIPRLWEASVNHMLTSLDKFEETNNNSSTTKSNSDSNLWSDLSPALKAEIQTLRGILRSSNRKQVYFSTYHEYLALLAEQLQYYRERLEDAEYCQANRLETETRLNEELESLRTEKASNGWYRNRNARLDRQIETLSQRLEGLSRGSNYAATKIERQRKRVNALRALWKEQKKVFGGGNDLEAYENRSNLHFEKKR